MGDEDCGGAGTQWLNSGYITVYQRKVGGKACDQIVDVNWFGESHEQGFKNER